MARSAAVKSKGASQGQLRLEAARAAAEVRLEKARAAEAECVAPPPAPPPVAPRAEPFARTVYVDEPPATPFGAWLVKQKGNRSEAIDALAKTAAADPRFPKAGDPEAVREYIGKKGADPDTFEAIDDAEAAWLRG